MRGLMQWWERKKAAHRKRKARAKLEMLERMGCTAINVVEFNGKLYVSHEGIPIVSASSLNTDIENVVAASRQSYTAWKNKFGNAAY